MQAKSKVEEAKKALEKGNRPTGGAEKEKDTVRKMEDVLFCRGSKIRTYDPLLPKQVR